MSDELKMEIAWKTTPAELRCIASYLERENCNQVRVNWYHTILCFVLDKEQTPAVIELEGETDGSITPQDIDERSQIEIIESAQYLNDKGIRDMIDYLKSLQEHRKERDEHDGRT